MSPRVAGDDAGVTNVSVRSRNRQDASFLDLKGETLDPNRHYRWVRCRSDEHLQSITKHQLRGYTVEKVREGGPQTQAEMEAKPDGTIAMGDLVLMSCPVDVHQQHVRARRARTETLLASTSANTKEMAKEKGVRIIDDTDD